MPRALKRSPSGVNIHPGYAKDKMINALQVVCEINALLPRRPTSRNIPKNMTVSIIWVGIGRDGRAGCFEYIIRHDHSREKVRGERGLPAKCREAAG
ncbi:MAG: hypothetical protein ACLR8Y_02455 [Alistipes indistinctus]